MPEIKNKKLRKKISEKYSSILEFSKEAGVSREIVYRILRYKQHITVDTAICWCRILGIDFSEIYEYFVEH